MIFVPLPFVFALLLWLLFLYLLRSNGALSTKPFLMLIGLCAIQSTIVGLRWGYGIAELRFVLPVLAVALPPLIYECFRGLVDHSQTSRIRLAAAPSAAFAIFILLLVQPILVDAAIIVLFAGYALALVKLAHSGPDGLDLARLESAGSAYRAMILAAACLFLSALFDILILLDFQWTSGQNALILVSNAHLFTLLLIGLAASVAARSRADKEGETVPDSAQADPTARDADVIARVDALMRDHKLYRDENLNLAKLARRTGLPARQVSSVINRVTGGNVSRYVNDFRIGEVRRILAEENTTITTAMFESGFATKSNFNREFQRVTGQSPDAWRKSARQKAEPAS
ncbi:helix-turn-helix domain-containing protein [Roseibium marinum]|uniref:AraC-like DNA-binding protein n=1 Tax=Roseibium marinum TaxID=281252 RepID=A0A2S3UKY7_9HYPH|nr:AraC family transcriptional regulator [Roseibium marinum]POF28366.1 AraC-like DNA-binding protein [Roseibium marinum]